LFGLSEGEFLKHHIALFPHTLPTPQTLRQQLVEGILKEEFGLEISDQLLLPPASEKKKEMQVQMRRENQALCPSFRRDRFRIT